MAGGRATRMGGGDKGLLELGGRRLIDHVIARLSPQCTPLALNANGDPARFADLGLPVLADSVGGYQGPLAGILAALDWADALGAEAVVTVAADTPFFPLDLAARLQEAADPAGLALAASPDETGRMRIHPTFGLWPVAMREDLRGDLAGGQRKVMLWAERHDAETAPFASEPFDPFFNINTPEDIAVAEEFLCRR